MTALALFIVTFVNYPPTPKKEENHIHPLSLFPAVNSFTNEQQIIYTACNWQPPVLLSLSLPHKIIHSILLAQTFFFPTLWICIWSSKCLVYCCHNWSCFGLKMKTLKPSLKLRKYHHYQKFNSTSLISKNRIISFDIIQGI